MSESHEDETANLQARIARLRKIIPHYIEYNKGRMDISASLLDQILGKVEELTEAVRVLSASEFNLAGHLVKVEAINKSLKESIKDTDVESGRVARLSEDLKGKRVPVAYLIHEKLKPARLSFQSLKGFVSQADIEEHELWQEALFTDPKNP